MAGEGRRFAEQGYADPKPFIPVTNYKTGELIPMFLCAASDLPYLENGGKNLNFVTRKSYREIDSLKKTFDFFPSAKLKFLDHITDGQASSAMEAIDLSCTNDLILTGCDHGMVLNYDKFNSLRDVSDVIVFTSNIDSTVMANPNAYGYVESENDQVRKVSVKKPFNYSDYDLSVIISTFWFKNVKIYKDSYEKMISNDDRVNGEFYIDKLIEYSIRIGYKVNIMKVDKFISWGTPKELENYEKTIDYWSKFYLKYKDLF